MAIPKFFIDLFVHYPLKRTSIYITYRKSFVICCARIDFITNVDVRRS